MFLSFLVLDDFFSFFNKIGFLGILGPPYCDIGATIRIGWEMLCLPYAGFFLIWTFIQFLVPCIDAKKIWTKNIAKQLLNNKYATFDTTKIYK